LEEEGMKIRYSEDVDWFNDLLKNGLSSVVYTPAIPASNLIWQACGSAEIPVIKRAKALGNITATKKCLAIGGTHGKTTTSSMLAHLLSSSDLPLIAFLGGISANFDSNFFFRNGESKEAVCVVEADEYDRSFLTLKPYSAVITSTDADHLDIYGERDSKWASIELVVVFPWVPPMAKHFLVAVILPKAFARLITGISADPHACQIKLEAGMAGV
jgi:UDP-N-acetylmuramate--alanine ligase